MTLRAALFSLLFLSPFCPAADSATVLKDLREQQEWAAIAARFAEPPAVKNEQAKTFDLAVSELPKDPKAVASVTVDKASGHVVEITSNSAAFTDEEVAGFAAFPELRALTLWHNSGGFTGASLAKLSGLARLERLTLAGGGLDDAGMAATAKIPTLRELRAWHSHFSDEGVAAFRGHPALESVTIGPMWEPLLTDRTLESLSECPKLKKLGLTETWLTWEHGLSNLVKRKETLQQIDLGTCLIEPEEVERLRREMPAAKVIWTPLGTGRDELAKSWLHSRAEAWIPKAMLDRASAPAK